MGRRLGMACGMAAMLVVARPALAQSSDDSATSPRPLRARIGGGFVSGLTDVPYNAQINPIFLGVAVRVGAQVDDRFAVFDELGVALWPELRTAVFFEWTPSAYIGVGVGGAAAVSIQPSVPGGLSAGWSAGGSLRLAAYVPYARGLGGRRYAVSFSVEITPSYAWAATLFSSAWSDFFQLGVLGGFGFDLY